jgi:hypothetical protein
MDLRFQNHVQCQSLVIDGSRQSRSRPRSCLGRGRLRSTLIFLLFSWQKTHNHHALLVVAIGRGWLASGQRVLRASARTVSPGAAEALSAEPSESNRFNDWRLVSVTLTGRRMGGPRFGDEAAR